MKFKTKIGIIGLGVISLIVIGMSIYWMVDKKTTSTLKEIKEKLPKKLEPKLVWEKEFDSEIEDVEVFTKPKDEFELPIISVETQKNIFLFDQKGSINRSFPYIPYEQRYFLTVSENGGYVMENKCVEEFTGDIKYTTSKGEVLWEGKNETEDYIISPTGERIVTITSHPFIEPSFPPVLKFYTHKKKILKEYPNLFIGNSYLFSGDGNYFIFHGNWNWGKGDEDSKLTLCDKDRNILWQKDTHSLGAEGILGISRYGERVVCNLNKDNKLFVLDNKGNIVCEIDPLQEQEDVQISPDGSFLVGKSEDFITIYDTFTGKQLWRKKWRVVGISFNSQLLFIQEKKGGKYYIINKEGENLFYVPLKQVKIVTFSNDSKSLYMITSINNAIYIYRVRLN